jgi:hypothetical protein
MFVAQNTMAWASYLISVHQESRSSKMFAVSRTISPKHKGMAKLWKHSEVDI